MKSSQLWMKREEPADSIFQGCSLRMAQELLPKSSPVAARRLGDHCQPNARNSLTIRLRNWYVLCLSQRPVPYRLENEHMSKELFFEKTTSKMNKNDERQRRRGPLEKRNEDVLDRHAMASPQKSKEKTNKMLAHPSRLKAENRKLSIIGTLKGKSEKSFGLKNDREWSLSAHSSLRCHFILFRYPKPRD